MGDLNIHHVDQSMEEIKNKNIYIMKSYMLLVLTLLVLLISCKKKSKSSDKSELTEVKTYYDKGEIKVIAYLDKDSLLTKTYRKFYENGNIKFKSHYIKGVESGKYTKYYKNGNVELVVDYENGVRNGKEIRYHKNGVLELEVTYNLGKETAVIAYDDKLNFSYYLRFNHLGGVGYRLDVDSLGNITDEAPHKFVYVTANTKTKDSIKTLIYKDSLELEVEIANPPSCKKVLYTRLNGVTKDSLDVSGIEYNYSVLPTDLGNNKLELFIDYYCTDYKLKSDYFTLNFEVVDE